MSSPIIVPVFGFLLLCTSHALNWPTQAFNSGTLLGDKLQDVCRIFTVVESPTVIETCFSTNTVVSISGCTKYDPFPDYIILGNQLSHGIFAWIEIGINATNNWNTYAKNAAYLAADGGHDNPSCKIGIVGTPPPDAG